MVLVRQLKEGLFEKTVVAIIIVLVLGAISFMTDFTGRVVDWVYTLTVTTPAPACWSGQL